MTLLLAAVACHPSGVAVTVERLVGPNEVGMPDVVSDVSTLQTFEIQNAGTAPAAVRLSVADPFFLPTPNVTVPAGGSLTVRVGISAPGYETLVSHIDAVSPHSKVSIPLRASFDLDADSDGFIANAAGGSDCNDRSASVSPAAVEVCDGIDNDCNGFVDDNAVDIGTWYRDADQDDWGSPTEVLVQCDRPPGYVLRKGDCDDHDPDVHPGADEIWYDGIDENCDGRSDYDRDGDGYDHWYYGGTDCRDTNPAIHPGATEIYYDGIDQNCDGQSDYDADGDGYDAAEYGGSDCDDQDASRHPGAAEVDDGIDQNCDGMVDETFVHRGDLVFSELLVQPSAVPAADGQFVELWNASPDRTIDLVGYAVQTAGGSETLPAVQIAPGAAAVLCANTDTASNGGLSCAAPLPAVLGTADHVDLTGDGALDEVDWTGWTLPTGASLRLGVLDPGANDSEASWCEATTPYGDGDLGTPGTVAADPCGTP